MSSLGRAIAAIVLAAIMLVPGVELLRFVMRDLIGLYPNMTQTDCLLFFVIVLLCGLLLQRAGEEKPKRKRSGDSALRLAGHETPPPKRRSTRTSSGRTRTREPSRSRTKR